jgi:S-ribosylhomocysteine lyase
VEKVESFGLDHKSVIVPYVREAETLIGPKGDVVQKFDLRFTQPNQEAIPTGAVHTLEHLLAVYFREERDDIIDISPMGCRTGFYLVKFGRCSEVELKGNLKSVLEKVVKTTDVPAANPKQCGNWRDHSLQDAVEYAKKVIAGLER